MVGWVVIHRSNESEGKSQMGRHWSFEDGSVRPDGSCREGCRGRRSPYFLYATPPKRSLDTVRKERNGRVGKSKSSLEAEEQDRCGGRMSSTTNLKCGASQSSPIFPAPQVDKISFTTKPYPRFWARRSTCGQWLIEMHATSYLHAHSS